MNHQIKHYSHKVGLNFWHIAWCTKYRYKMMSKLGNRNLVCAAIRKVAYRHNIQIHQIEVLSEHIHLLGTLPKGKDEAWAFHKLKGGSSYFIFKNKENFRLRYPKGHFWSRGGCAVTVGYNDFNKTKDYIRKQLEHHSQRQLSIF